MFVVIVRLILFISSSVAHGYGYVESKLGWVVAESDHAEVAIVVLEVNKAA
jgi:hypothetical protein